MTALTVAVALTAWLAVALVVAGSALWVVRRAARKAFAVHADEALKIVNPPAGYVALSVRMPCGQLLADQHLVSLRRAAAKHCDRCEFAGCAVEELSR
jgi:hypothetical protein